MGMPNIITGLILALGRVSGETAPILFTCAAYFLPQLPTSIFDQCMALPYHLYVISTSGTNMEAQLPLAYGTALVLILIILLVNLVAPNALLPSRKLSGIAFNASSVVRITKGTQSNPNVSEPARMLSPNPR